MDDLAVAAGVTKPVFYQHFPSKRALFVAVLEDVGGRLLEVLTEATASVETGRARVEQGFSAYFHFVENDRAAFRLLFGASARNDPEFADVVDRVLDDTAAAVSTLIEIHGSDEHRQVLAHAHRRDGRGDEPPRARPIRTDHTTPITSPTGSPSSAWFGLRGVRSDD